MFEIIQVNSQLKVRQPMDTFQVYSRCRPLNDLQINYGAGRKAVSILDDRTISVNDGNGKQHTFELNGVFDQFVSNSEIFGESIVPLIENVLNGINSTVFAYGITGAGKSFTMFGKTGNSQLPGIIPLTFQYLAQKCEQDTNTKLKISYLEIYNEQVFDLLQPNQQNLQLSEDPIQGCVIVQDLTEMELHSFQEVEDLIAIGNSRRVIAQTKANEVSSRSHAIVIINIERRFEDTDQLYSAKLSLVDLAGSEKQSVHAETRGIRTFEGSNINRSLLTLGNCINILSEKRKINPSLTQQFIPYRDSKLTRLLKDSLGGNTKTVMIACVSPSCLYYEQTVNTLKYACRANKIEKVVHQNIKQVKSVDDYKKEVQTLRKENDILKMNLNMSLMMPGLSVGILEQDSKIKKIRVTQILQRLTKVIEERVILMGMSDADQRMESIQKVVRAEEELKQSIIEEFTLKGTKKSEPNRTEKPFENPSRNRNTQRATPSQIAQIPSKTKLPVQQRTSFSQVSQPNQKSNYSQYKLSLKEELKAIAKPQNEPQNRVKNGPMINLQNLRKKFMEDKKQTNDLKQQIIEGSLTQIQNNILQQNGVQHSRNRHLKSLNRIILMARGKNPHQISYQNPIGSLPASEMDRQHHSYFQNSEAEPYYIDENSMNDNEIDVLDYSYQAVREGAYQKNHGNHYNPYHPPQQYF